MVDVKQIQKQLDGLTAKVQNMLDNRKVARKLSEEEKEAVWVALGVRRNIIETGSYSLSAADISNMGAEAAKEEFGAEILPLSTDQIELIIRTEKLITAALQDRLMIIEE